MNDTPTPYEILHDIRYFPYFCKNFLKIMPTKGGLIPFNLNPIQKYVFEEFIEKDYIAGSPVRVACLKERQSGMSTLVQALAIWYVLGHKHSAAVLVANTDETARKIFRIMKRYRDHLPDQHPTKKGPGLLPYFPLASEREGVLEFNEPKGYKRGRRDGGIILDSRIDVNSAYEKEALGRGGTYQFAHCSEAAYWPSLISSMSAMLQACHEEPETIVFLETTAKGYNEFYDFWMNLKIGRTDVPSIWKKCFIPWYWDNKYEKKCPKGQKTFYDESEEGLFHRMQTDKTLKRLDKDLTKERCWNKLAWRRQAIDYKFFGDLDEFHQEFPSTESEAFSFSGESVWPAVHINRLEKDVRNPEWRGNIEVQRKSEEGNKKIITTPIFEEHERGRMQIWEEPQKYAKYVIGADIAEGKASEGISEDKSKRDFSCAQIIRVDTFPPVEQVAVWHGNIDPDLFGYLLVALGIQYNGAMLSWEIRGSGRALTDDIVRKCKYRYYYRREVTDDVLRRPTNKPGWDTNAKTKPMAVSIGKSFAREKELVIHDAGTLSEMKAYAQLGENRYGAARGHDDRVMALLIALASVEPDIMRLKRKSEREKEADKSKDKPKRIEPPGMLDNLLGTEY